MNEQEVYDIIITHLRKQGSKSMLSEDQTEQLDSYADEGICAYRGADGKKCAAGIMIEDFEYSPKMEGINIGSVLGREDCPASLVERLGPHFHLISDLQFVHDKSQVANWEREFKRVALQYRLDYTAPNATDS